uniref:Uncharacterized protein n=1 Tax=Rhizophora mucronata TaxID=61149 RepID=A0A2P2N7X9_RHIMU
MLFSLYPFSKTCISTLSFIGHAFCELVA